MGGLAPVRPPVAIPALPCGHGRAAGRGGGGGGAGAMSGGELQLATSNAESLREEKTILKRVIETGKIVVE
jgi:hypothetical protein